MGGGKSKVTGGGGTEFHLGDDDSVLYKGRADLTQTEIDYLNQYSIMSGTPNSYLRYPKKLSSLENLDVIKNGIPAIDSAIARSSLDKSIYVYRTMDMKYLPKNLSVGVSFSDKAFNSTSLFRSEAEKFKATSGQSIMAKILVPSGKGKGIYISDIAGAQNQKEFLIKRNAKYKIMGRGSDGTLYLQMM